MKYHIKRPKIFITEADDSNRYLFIVENTTILSVLWFIQWYGSGAMQKLRIEATGLRTDIYKKDFYVPKMDKKDMIKYIKTAKEINICINKLGMQVDKIFGLLPLNTLITFTVEVDKWIIDKRMCKSDIEMMPKRNDRYEFPMSDFGYFQKALEKARKEFKESDKT